MLDELTASNGRRFTWLDRIAPSRSLEALQFAMDLSPWAWGGENTIRDSWYLNRCMHSWFNDEHVPDISEVLMAKPILPNDLGVEPMSTTEKNPIAKSIAYAEKHDLFGKITLADNGTITSSDDLVETTAALDAGLTMDQVKKFQKSLGELIPAATYVAGLRAEEGFKANPELTETGFSFNVGSHQKVAGLFHRDNKDHTVVVVETTHRSAEFQRVVTHINGLFDDINN